MSLFLCLEHLEKNFGGWGGGGRGWVRKKYVKGR